ncbi:MAG: hypothetical protein Q9166_005877 [cf. Caloplaca sp. 2 TL-2023]
MSTNCDLANVSETGLDEFEDDDFPDPCESLYRVGCFSVSVKTTKRSALEDLADSSQRLDYIKKLNQLHYLMSHRHEYVSSDSSEASDSAEAHAFLSEVANVGTKVLDSLRILERGGPFGGKTGCGGK